MINQGIVEEERSNRVSSKMKTAEEVPLFSEQQVETFNSEYVDSLDEALAVLDETNSIPDLNQHEKGPDK